MSDAFTTRIRRNRLLFAGAMLGTLLVVLIAVGLTQMNLRAQAKTHQMDLARADAHSLEDFLTHNLKSVDLMLQGLAQVDAGEHTVAPDRMLQTVRSMPLLRSISLLDERGMVHASTSRGNLGARVPVADFSPQTEANAELLRIGPPWAGRDFADGEPAFVRASRPNAPPGPAFIPLLRVVRDSSGQWQRFLVALNVDHVLNAYIERVGADRHTVELFRYDGVLLLSTDVHRTPGRVDTDSGLMRQLPLREVGEFQETLKGGAPVLTAFRASSTHPLVTVVRYDLDEVLAPWRHNAQTLWGLTLGVLAVSVAVASAYYVRLENAARARWAVNRQMRLAASVYTHAQEAITITDLQGQIVSVNEAFTRITGYSADEVLGQNPRILSSGRQSKEFYAQLWQSLKEDGHWEGEIWNRRKSGEVYAELLNITVVPDEHGHPQNYVAIFLDITQQKNHQAQLERIAHFDALTGLPNRVLLADRLQQALAQAQRRGTLMAVVFLDLDGFKSVNDQHGHSVGDQLLVALAQRLRESLREGDTLSRMGGDEFVAVLADLDDVRECECVLERLLLAASLPVDLGGRRMRLSASLGAALYPQDGSEPDTLLRHADQAMYEAKQAGKGRYQLFDVAQDISTRKRVEGRARLAQALLQQEFVLHYQPKVDLRRGRVCGAEVLLRWQDPQRGLLSPGLFLPDIEGHALSTQLGDWVLASALTQLSDWTAAGLALPLSVNISAHHLQQAHFVARLAELLALHPRVSPNDLELEVLETSALQDMGRVSQVMHECQAMGVSFALDDFGTGYSSLTYLKRLPASVLKIDQSFVRDMLDNPDDLAIVQGVIGLSQAFHRRVIAEGVETRAHADRLVALGCDLAQGYGIARPMPAEVLPDWVSQWEQAPHWAPLQPGIRGA